MSMDLIADVLGYGSVIVGAFVFLGAAVGLVRFADLYMRSSAVATAAGLGIIFIIVGAFLLHPEWSATPKVIIAVLLQLASSAVGSMAIARAGFLSGAPISDMTRYSEIGPLEPADVTSEDEP